MLKAIFKEIWYKFPVIFLIFNGLSLVYLYSARLPAEISSYSLAVIFPLFWALYYYYLRFEGANNKQRYLKLASIFLGIAILYIILLSLPKHATLDRQEFKLVFEISNILFAGIFALHALTVKGYRRWLNIFIISGIYGLLLESGGIQMGFFNEQGYYVYLPGVHAPLATLIGWCSVFYMVTFIAEEIAQLRPGIKRNIFIYALLPTMIGLFFDLQLDPLASRMGLWTWAGRLEGFFMEVPLVNFLAWFSALYPFSLVYLYLTGRGDLSEGKKSLYLVLSILPVLLADLVLIMFLTLITCGFNSPTMEIFIQALTKPFLPQS